MKCVQFPFCAIRCTNSICSHLNFLLVFIIHRSFGLAFLFKGLKNILKKQSLNSQTLTYHYTRKTFCELHLAHSAIKKKQLFTKTHLVFPANLMRKSG